MNLSRKTRGEQLRRGAGGLFVAAVGVLLLLTPVSESWSDRSYDLLLRLRLPIDVRDEEVVIVDMDADSEAAFGQVPVLAWNRRLHAQLVDRLREQGAHVIAFDVLFRNTDGMPMPGDDELLRAVQKHGRVVFGAALQPKLSPTGETAGLEIWRPFPTVIPLEQVGLVEQSFTGDRAIRQHLGSWRGVRSLAWRIAELTMAELPGEPSTPRWVNYYGPPFTTVPHVSFLRVMSNSVPASLNFSNKVVFVGARTSLGPTGGTGADYHPMPFGQLITGVEINATTYLNLRRSDWLRRASVFAEAAFITLTGCLLGYALGGVSPLRAVVLVVIVAATGFAGVLALCWVAHFWFPWLIVVGAQLPCALALPILFRRATARDPGMLESDGPRIQPSSVEGSVAAFSNAPRISDHTMLRCVGRGAYGEVWLARDVIGSFHAVKLVYRSSFQSDEPFEREFRGMQKYTPLSRNHPGWVHILHVGKNEAEGYFFYVMEAGDDETTGQEIDPACYHPRNLAKELEKRRRLPIGESVEIGVALAEALDYLHGQLLVHRDIKPSNVIFVHGAPKFADVGLVTEVRNKDHTVSMLGTEGYIAPEGLGTAAADIYSLGKLLYEMTTGRDRRAFPEAASSLVPTSGAGAHQRLSDIIAKACREDPRERYQSASDLRDDLSDLQRTLASH